ncbi:RHS repeat-associated core domain-containing protein [Luteibacter sp.]|uniref:RHS repeat-associated core domain-containing protein n=1 Tax=Luteibacter sp. TaxID=1886636 RepID=UPI003F7FCF6B
MKGSILTAGLLALLAGQVFAKEVTYYYTDPQGTVLMTTDASGNQKSHSERSPFGRQVASDQPDGPGYTGHVDDGESQLIYMQARYYDGALGRFLSMDPLPAVPANLDRFNRYQYAGNSPYNNIDPDGRDQVVIAGGRRTDSINAFGHIGIAVEGYGMASYGTDTPLGSSSEAYVGSQALSRDQVISVIGTTPSQDTAAINMITSQLNTNGAGLIDNCAVKVTLIMHAAGVRSSDAAFPGAVSRSVAGLTGTKTWYLTRNQPIPKDLLEILRRIDQSRKKDESDKKDKKDPDQAHEPEERKDVTPNGAI